MAITENNYVGNGSTVLFSFTFPYLDEADIKVSLDDADTTEYTLANATTIEFDTAPADGVAIRIYRSTDTSELLATFFPGSAIRAQDLNENFLQGLYSAQESQNGSDDANDIAELALTTANAAVVTANAAEAKSDAAVSTSNTALDTANAATTTANNALDVANTAEANSVAALNAANDAVDTANQAAADASTALSTANTALSTANDAAADAATAIATANAADSKADSAIATANNADAAASQAVSTANTALTNSNTAIDTADQADAKADQALAAVANALLFTVVQNVAAIPTSPEDGDAVEVTDSTGIESFTPLVGVPAGFVGDDGLGVRIIYEALSSTWRWLQYFPQDPDNRYLNPSDQIILDQRITAAQGDATQALSDAAQALSDAAAAQVTADNAQSAVDSLATDVSTNYLTIAQAASTYQDKADMVNYLTTAVAASTYQTQADMVNYLPRNLDSLSALP